MARIRAMKTGQATALRGKLVANLTLLSRDDQRPQKRYQNLKILQRRIMVAIKIEPRHASRYLFITRKRFNRKWNR